MATRAFFVRERTDLWADMLHTESGGWTLVFDLNWELK